MSKTRKMSKTRMVLVSVLVLFAAVWSGKSAGQVIPLPEPDPIHPNVFYGAVPAPGHLPPGVGETVTVLVFVHGLGGTAMNWWEDNDMYETALWTLHRTAFISLSEDNTPNKASIETNAAVLQELLPRVTQHFDTDKVVLIGHSKGGVDIQAAMLDAATAGLVKAVFTISSPNHGTELADWAFDNPELAEPLDLLNPGVESLTTSNMATFRATADPILKSYGIPFYTITGTDYTGNPLSLVTGSILKSLVPGIGRDTLNDGFVTVARSRLPDDYAADLGIVPVNHFATDSGSATFAQISGRVTGHEFGQDELSKIAVGGFAEFGGSPHNSWIWSAKWFKGKLYVGTGREVDCVSLLTSDRNTGTEIYPLNVLSEDCPDGFTLSQSLGAEIWRYTPETATWERVFKSPRTIPVAFDDIGDPTVFTARDIGFRGMTVFQEADGEEALYAAGVTSGSVYDPVPFGPDGFPPPRLLRTTDGMNWAPVPQEPGTFLGEIGNVLIDPETKFRGFRSLVTYKGMLFATVSNFIGNGVIIASSNPSAGNDAWQQVSPSRAALPVWTLTVFNDFLYATTGLTKQQDPTNPGYGVYKTDAEGEPPYDFVPVVVNGGHQPVETFRAPNGLSFGEFNGQLYVGTNRPPELIRINPDDSWELVVGEPRDTPLGYKAPISGFGNGFANGFIGHFWRMASYNGHLYLGTWDWSVVLQGLSFLDPLDKLFTAHYGFDLLRSDDGVHWTSITGIGMGVPANVGARSLEATPVGLFVGTAAQKRHGADVFLSTGPSGANPLPAPARLCAASEASVGRKIDLAWQPSPGAVRYRVYRSSALLIPPIKSQVPLTFKLVAVVNDTTFSSSAPPNVQSIFFVRAENEGGNLSDPSNIVAAPSKAEPSQCL